ncbi:ribonuclease HI [Cellulophaga fucicola]|uniref:Ribonuclease H n=1 Tax=Cellulophaga fucicola TaxID=76595 RepID=A0A1K1QX58_9FLAO|nr:ribonuclease HI [Cellulophaga fucicola]SFW64257.1 ribonuclease HI [Cellulophaga fucicola]
MKEWEVKPNVELYSDGGAEPNPGKGGFGVILTYNDKKKEFFKGYKLTTNNRMELMGVIFGLEKLTVKSNVQVYTDSKYVIDGITKGWAQKWKKNGWKRTKNTKAVNSDLWDKLLTVIEKHSVEFNWVKGHSGHIENERCDTLAGYGINSNDKIDDTGYELKDTSVKEASVNQINSNSLNKIKVNKEGDPCRKCNEPVVKKMRNKKTKIKPSQTYYFEYTLFCNSCKTIYMLEEAKRHINQNNNLFNE